MWALLVQVRILPLTINGEVLIEDHSKKSYVCLANSTLSNFYNVGECLTGLNRNHVVFACVGHFDFRKII